MGHNLREIAQKLQNSDKTVQLIYAFNGVGKTRLSLKFKDLISLVFERLFYSGYVAMAKIRFTEFLPSTGCHHSVCPHYRHLARP